MSQKRPRLSEPAFNDSFFSEVGEEEPANGFVDASTFGGLDLDDDHSSSSDEFEDIDLDGGAASLGEAPALLRLNGGAASSAIVLHSKSAPKKPPQKITETIRYVDADGVVRERETRRRRVGVPDRYLSLWQAYGLQSMRRLPPNTPQQPERDPKSQALATKLFDHWREDHATSSESEGEAAPLGGKKTSSDVADAGPSGAASATSEEVLVQDRGKALKRKRAKIRDHCYDSDSDLEAGLWSKRLGRWDEATDQMLVDAILDETRRGDAFRVQEIDWQNLAQLDWEQIAAHVSVLYFRATCPPSKAFERSRISKKETLKRVREAKKAEKNQLVLVKKAQAKERAAKRALAAKDKQAAKEAAEAAAERAAEAARQASGRKRRGRPRKKGGVEVVELSAADAALVAQRDSAYDAGALEDVLSGVGGEEDHADRHQEDLLAIAAAGGTSDGETPWADEDGTTPAGALMDEEEGGEDEEEGITNNWWMEEDFFLNTPGFEEGISEADLEYGMTIGPPDDEDPLAALEDANGGFRKTLARVDGTDWCAELDQLLDAVPLDAPRERRLRVYTPRECKQRALRHRERLAMLQRARTFRSTYNRIRKAESEIPFSKTEDILLLQLAQKHRNRSWLQIAREFQAAMANPKNQQAADKRKKKKAKKSPKNAAEETAKELSPTSRSVWDLFLRFRRQLDPDRGGPLLKQNWRSEDDAKLRAYEIFFPPYYHRRTQPVMIFRSLSSQMPQYFHQNRFRSCCVVGQFFRFHFCQTVVPIAT